MAAASDAQLARLAREAQRLRAHGPWRAWSVERLPALFFLTDPQRTPDPITIAERLPRGSGVILRHFGRPEAHEEALALKRVARARGLRLLVAADPQLAQAIGADGVHWPQRWISNACIWGIREPRWLMTAACHTTRALTQAEAVGCDGAFVSPALPSRSPSAGRALGPVRTSLLAANGRLPVLGLGGVTANTIVRLRNARLAGVGAVEGFAS